MLLKYKIKENTIKYPDSLIMHQNIIIKNFSKKTFLQLKIENNYKLKSSSKIFKSLSQKYSTINKNNNDSSESLENNKLYKVEKWM